MNTSDNKKRMLDALEKTWGIVTPACRIVGISRQTHYAWYNGDSEYREAVDELKTVGKDNAEYALVKLCEGPEYQALDMDGNIVTLKDKPNSAAVIFANKTLNKDRGYIEKQEIDMNVQPVVIQSAVDGSDTN